MFLKVPAAYLESTCSKFGVPAEGLEGAGSFRSGFPKVPATKFRGPAACFRIVRNKVLERVFRESQIKFRVAVSGVSSRVPPIRVSRKGVGSHRKQQGRGFHRFLNSPEEGDTEGFWSLPKDGGTA